MIVTAAPILAPAAGGAPLALLAAALAATAVWRTRQSVSKVSQTRTKGATNGGGSPIHSDPRATVWR